MNRQSAGNHSKEIIEFYSQEKDILKTAKQFDIGYETTRKIIRKAGFISNKKKPIKSDNLDLNYFKNIDTQDKAYFAGFIKADGYIDKSRNRFALRLEEFDINILEKFCDAINLNIKRINTIRKKDRLNFCKEIAIQNKLFVEPILDIKFESFLSKMPEEFSGDFIRGYFDGDGCISYRHIKKAHFQMNIMGNPMDDHMLKYIIKYIPNFRIYLDKRSDLPLIQSANKNDLNLFYQKIYTNSFIYLQRKKEKFDLFKYYYELTSTTTRKTSETLKDKDEDIV